MNYRGNHRLLAAAFLSIFFCLGLSPVRAADAPGSSAFLEEAVKTEGEIASMLGQRAQLTGPQRAVVDFQIDVRIISRWLLRRAAAGKDQDQIRDCAALRCMEIQAVAEQLNARITSATKPLSATQLDGLSRLHQVTYKLDEIKSVRLMDETCKAIALDLILASDPSPADTRFLPPMRPALPRSITNGKSGTSPTDYAARIKSLSISEPLRRQLNEIHAALVEAKQKDEVAGLRETLLSALSLSETVARGTGMDPMARPRIEQQLTEALTLYADVRTRSAGKSRLTSLDQISRSLAGVQQVKLPPALQEKLEPALIWAGRNPDHGDQVLKLVERDVELSARFESIKDYASLPAGLRRAVEPLVHKCAGEQIRFIQQVGELDGASTSGALSGLESHAKQMQELIEQINAIQQLSHAATQLAVYKPRPTGALDRRATSLLTELGATTTANHDAALHVVEDIVRLAKIAETLSEISSTAHGVSPEVAREYTRSLIAAAEAHRPLLIGELATQLAANKPLNRTDFFRLQNYEKLLSSLTQATELEAALSKVEVLNRWADWSITPARLRALFAPYREATAAAFDGFALDNAVPLEHWLEARRTYSPLIAFVLRDSAFADACAGLPGGLFGELSKLMTPMDNQPFETERYASVAASLWTHYVSSADSRSADAILNALVAQLAAESSGVQ